MEHGDERRTASRALAWWDELTRAPPPETSPGIPPGAEARASATLPALPALPDIEAARQLPSRDAALARQLYLVRLDSPPHHVIEHGGATLEAAFGAPVAGRALPEALPGEFASQLAGFIEAARIYARPVADCAVYTDLDEGRLVYYRNLLLPVRQEGGVPASVDPARRQADSVLGTPTHVLGLFSYRIG